MSINKDKDKIVTLIPARSGSKRIKDKNLTMLKDKSLIEWSIFYAKKSKFINDIFVSSDASKILNKCKKYKITGTIKRNKKLSNDKAKLVDVAIDFVKKINKSQKYKYLVILQPTSPFRTNKDIDTSINYFLKNKCDGVTAISKSRFPSEWAFKNKKLNLLDNFNNTDFLFQRSQDLSQTYKLTGSIFVIKISHLLKKRSLYLKKNFHGVEIPELNAIDIDDEIDLEYVKYLIGKKN